MTAKTYSYVNGNPVNLSDPTGHDPAGPCSKFDSRRCAVGSKNSGVSRAQANAIDARADQQVRSNTQSKSVRSGSSLLGRFTDSFMQVEDGFFGSYVGIADLFVMATPHISGNPMHLGSYAFDRDPFVQDSFYRHVGADPGARTTKSGEWIGAIAGVAGLGRAIATRAPGALRTVGGLFKSAPADREVAASADDVTRLYRAVDPEELKDIAGTGVYRSAPGGTEGKYFFPTKEQAENFSNLMDKTGTGPYCTTSGYIPKSTLKNIDTIHPAGEGTAYFIPEDLLPQFRDIIHDR